MNPQRNDLTPVEELQWRARRIDAVARAMYEADYPDSPRGWTTELELLAGPKKRYSLVPRYRQLADVAIATVRDYGEYT